MTRQEVREIRCMLDKCHAFFHLPSKTLMGKFPITLLYTVILYTRDLQPQQIGNATPGLNARRRSHAKIARQFVLPNSASPKLRHVKTARQTLAALRPDRHLTRCFDFY